MSEQIVREGGTRQETIEDDYRESAQIFEPGLLKVFIRRRLSLICQAFGKVAPNLTNIQPNTCRIT